MRAQYSGLAGPDWKLPQRVLFNSIFIPGIIRECTKIQAGG